MNHELLLKQFASLIKDENQLIPILANASAFLNDILDDINWVGFYLWHEDESELVLGPFQGKPACNRIKMGKGVCGTSYQKNETTVVPDVDQFPGHIVCDFASRSEIVIPFKGQRTGVSGVLDIDAPILDRFSASDREFLEKIVALLKESI